MSNNVKTVPLAIPQERIREHIEEYKSSNIRHPGSMNTADPGKFMNAYDEIISEHVKRKVKCVSGNYYKHNLPYMPHTDFKSHLGNFINVVIPLEYTGEQPRFVVFDQQWRYESVTWSMHYPVKKFGPYCGINTAVKGCPYEYDVTSLTDKPIDTKLYEEHLSHLKKEHLFGLSCKKVSYFSPGNIIIFNNQNIHCTSSFSGEKLGLSLRYR